MGFMRMSPDIAIDEYVNETTRKILMSSQSTAEQVWRSIEGNDLMPRNPRILQPRPLAVLHQRITVADATSLNFDPNQARLGLRNFPFYKFQWPTRTSHLCDTHLRHRRRIQTEQMRDCDV